MLMLSPDKVTFAGLHWPEVIAVAIERVAEKSVLEWSDDGPHAIFADVPEERMTIRITRLVSVSELDVPGPGALGELIVHASLGPSDARRRVIRALGVIERVSYQFVQKAGATQVISLVAISESGDASPLVIEPA